MKKICLIMTILCSLLAGGICSAAPAQTAGMAEFDQTASGVWGDVDVDVCDMPDAIAFKYYYFVSGQYGCGYTPFFNDHTFGKIGEVRRENDGSYSVSSWNEYGHELNERIYFLQNAFFVMDDPERVFVYMGIDAASAQGGERPFIREYASTQLASQTWRREYGGILDFWGMARLWTDTPHVPYSLYDIDRNGIPEMFLCIGTNMGDHRDILLTIDLPTGKARYVTALRNGHSEIFVSNEAGSFVRSHVRGGEVMLIRYTIAGNQIVDEIVPAQDRAKYGSWMPIESYLTSDRAGLY